MEEPSASNARIGHLAKFCRQPMNRPENSSNYRQEEPRRHLNHLNAKGGCLVKKFIMCNGLKLLVLIDTGAVITAVSRTLVNRWQGTTHRWKGPEVTLANGQNFKPQKCIHLKVEHPEGEATDTALNMNLTEVDVLLGNDFLEQFSSLKIEYEDSFATSFGQLPYHHEDNLDTETLVPKKISLVLLNDYDSTTSFYVTCECRDFRTN